MSSESELSIAIREMGNRVSRLLDSVSARSTLRIVIAIVFIVSGAAKLWDIYGFSVVVRGYWPLPESLVIPISMLIPFAEVVLGAMLLIDLHSQVATLSLLTMVLAFTGLSAFRYLGGNISDCGCFGELARRKIGGGLFIENALLIIALSFTVPKNTKSEVLPRGKAKQ